MILIDKVEIVGLEPAIRGMRNPLNSWDKSDSGICKGGDNGIGCSNCALGVDRCDRSYDHTFQIGVKDYCLMRKLANGGPVHAKYRRMITVYLDVTAPLYWWKEFDTYKVVLSPTPAPPCIQSMRRSLLWMISLTSICLIVLLERTQTVGLRNLRIQTKSSNHAMY